MDGRSPRTRGSHRGAGRGRQSHGSIPAHAGEPAGSRRRPRWRRVDPRARGGAATLICVTSKRDGRSPRTRGSRASCRHRRAHGRSIPAHAGEPASPATTSAPAGGRSPRTRGSPRRRVVYGGHSGSIPAHAGEPGSKGRTSRPWGVDPRARGGAPTIRSPATVIGGRSPRTRGSLRRVVLHNARQGSIPAHAGEPRQAGAARGRAQVDPRARGGASRSIRSDGCASGRSPRTRGSPRPMARPCAKSGSIPAHAGEPRPRAGSRGGPGVDPRARGGAATFFTFAGSVAGRSPRTRGSQRHGQVPPVILGSIPAHAGEPATARPPRSRAGVDPRARGGAQPVSPGDVLGEGRSPRTRGSPLPGEGPGSKRRSIPAHAGEPRGSACPGGRHPVDPRARGGAKISTRLTYCDCGRSPRTRGSHAHTAPTPLSGRSIPAHAGEPSGASGPEPPRQVDPRARGGARAGAGAQQRGHGSIPAHAGEPAQVRSH